MAYTYTASELIERAETLESERHNWEQDWQRIADFVLPRKNDIITKRSRGENRNQKRYASVGMQSLSMLAASLHGTLTSKAVQWFDLETGNPDMDSNPEIKQYFQDVARFMWMELNSSNFHAQVHELYLDLAAFGTGCMIQEEAASPGDDYDGIIFMSHPIQSYLIEENHHGQVDSVCVKHMMTARQIRDKFGESAMTRDHVAAMNKSPLDQFEILHWVMPRDGGDDDYTEDASKMPFNSCWVDRGQEEIIKEGGYQEFPFTVPRWSKSTGDMYGRGPGDTALADIEVLNEATRLELNAWAKTIDPPILVEDDGVIGKVNMRPGKPTVVRDVERSIRPFQSNANMNFNQIKLGEYRNTIRQAFFADQLELPNRGSAEMTATEIQVRYDLMQRVLGPTLGRLERELLEPVILRAFRTMVRRGVVPEPPDSLGDVLQINVRYVGPLSRAQKQSEINAFMTFLQEIGMVAQMKPEVLDLIDGDATVRWLHDHHDLPSVVLVQERIVEQRREAKAKQEQALAQQQFQSAGAQDAKTMAQAEGAMQEAGATAQEMQQNEEEA
tara:strand:- start:1455 stop:3125 length:1671 start_codon:yes stop_codon:yes gene_type:complete